jgi:hypothetical protein
VPLRSLSFPLLVLCIAGGLAVSIQARAAQDASVPTLQLPRQPRDIGAPEKPPTDIEREREKKANAERQQKLKRDTDQLLKLATELKQAVDKSNEHTLSLDVVKRAGDIEKLAKNIKEKMRGY